MKLVGMALIAAACGGPPAVATPTQPTQPTGAQVLAASRTQTKERAPIDPIASLSADEDAEVAWLRPGKIQLELGGQILEGPGPAKPVRVRIIDAHGAQVRLALELGHARFSVWSHREDLFALLARSLKLAPTTPSTSNVHVTLKQGARVIRIGHDDKEKRSRVRYVGAVEAEGWVPDDVLVDTAPPRQLRGRIPTAGKNITVMPGSVIRADAKWTATQLAVMSNGFFLDALNELADGWSEVAYADDEIALRGFVTSRLPPGRTHRTKIDPETAPVKITANAKVGAGTCLHLRAGGDPVGYLVGDQEAELEEAGQGWWDLAIDTPWGALTFAARGATAAELATCDPRSPITAP